MKLDKNRRPSFTHQHPKDILNDLLNTEESDIHNLATTAGERKDLGLEDDIMTLLMDHPTLDLTPPPELDKDVATLTAEEGSQLVDFYRNKFEAAVELLGKLDLGSSQGTALFGKFLEVVKKEEPRAVKALKDIAYFMGHQDDKSYEAAAAADQSTNEASDTNAVLALKKKRSDFPRRLLKQESAQQKTYQPETYDQRHLKSRRWNDPAHFAADLPPMFQSQHGRWLLGNGRHAARGLSHGRRRLTKSSQESKQEQCQRLVDCTSSMVKYDLFAFFYSDDIDPTTGKLDDKRVTFDELDINTKYQNMTDILALFFFEYSRGTGYPWQSGDTLRDMFARCVAEHGRGNCEEVRKEEWHTDEMVIVYPKCSVGYNTVGCCTCRAVNHVVGSNEEAFRNCDKLLRLFHRNKENSQNAKWEGGRVDQVCLAQGTNQYIDLGNLIAQRFHMGFDALESVPTFLPTESVPNHLANDYLQDCCFVIADDEVMFQSEGYQYNICQEKLNSIWEDNRMLYSLSYGRLIDIFEQQGVPVGDVKEIKSGYASQSGDYINVGIGGYFGASNARDGSLDTFSHTPDSGAKNSYWELILDPHHILTKITLHGRKGLLDRSTGAQLRMGICDSFCDGHLVANIDYNSTDMIEFQLNPKAGPNIEPGLATWPVRWVRVFKRYDHPNPYVELVEVKLWGVEVPTAAHPHTGRPYPGANWRGDKSKMKKVAQDYAEDLAFENFWKQELNNAFNIAASNFFQSKILEESIYDVVDCSWQLFDSSDRSGNSKFATETFVFGSPGKGEDGFFNNLRIPTQHKRNCGVEAERCSSSKYDNHGQYDPTATGEYFLFKNLTDIYNVEDLTECMDGLVEKVKRDIYDAFKDRMKIYKESMSFSDETNVFQAFFDPTLHDEVESFFYNYFDDFRDKCIQKEVMDVITHGLALIFGEKASPGKS